MIQDKGTCISFYQYESKFLPASVVPKEKMVKTLTVVIISRARRGIRLRWLDPLHATILVLSANLLIV